MIQDSTNTQASTQTTSNSLSRVLDGTNIDAARTAPKPRASRVKRWGNTAKPANPEWIINQLILKGAVNNVAGEPGVGKTRMAAHLAAHIVVGEPFLGRKVRQGPVLYLNFDDSEVLPRMWTERAIRGLDKELSDVPLFYWEIDEEDSNKVKKAKGLLDSSVFNHVSDWIAGIKDVEGSHPILIVVDTFETAFPGADSNNANAVLAAYEKLNQLQEAAGDAAILLIDHTPKRVTNESSDRGVSGSQQKKARARTQHIISSTQSATSANSDVVTWKVDKNNAGPNVPPFAIRREFCELEDADYIYADNLPRSTGSPKEDKAYDHLTSLVRDSDGKVIPRKDLLKQAIQDLGTGERVISAALTKLQDDPRISTHKLGGPGNPLGLSWASDSSQGEQDAFRASSTASNNSRLARLQFTFDADIYTPPQGQEHRKVVDDKPNEDEGPEIIF